MNKKDFKFLLKSIKQARAIHEKLIVKTKEGRNDSTDRK